MVTEDAVIESQPVLEMLHPEARKLVLDFLPGEGTVFSNPVLYSKLCRTNELIRLRGIRQAGTAEFSSHTRFDHSVLTAFLGDRIMAANRRSQREASLLLMSSLLHDVAITPYSEEGMLPDPLFFGEERNAGLFLESSTALVDILSGYFSQLGIGHFDVLNCIRGDYPVVGELLSSRRVDVDKISYVLLDSAVLRSIRSILTENEHTLSVSAYNQDRRNFQDYSSFFDLLDRVGDLSGIGNECVVSDEGVYFTNPGRLADFLELRARLFTDYYFSPGNMARKAFVGTVLRNLFKKGKLRRTSFLRMDDKGLEEAIWGGISVDDFERVFEFPFYSGFREVERHYNQSEGDVLLGVPKGYFVAKCPGFNPALETRVLTEEGSVVPFRAALPQKAGEIQKLADSCNYVGVYKRV